MWPYSQTSHCLCFRACTISMKLEDATVVVVCPCLCLCCKNAVRMLHYSLAMPIGSGQKETCRRSRVFICRSSHLRCFKLRGKTQLTSIRHTKVARTQGFPIRQGVRGWVLRYDVFLVFQNLLKEWTVNMLNKSGAFLEFTAVPPFLLVEPQVQGNVGDAGRCEV